MLHTFTPNVTTFTTPKLLLLLKTFSTLFAGTVQNRFRRKELIAQKTLAKAVIRLSSDKNKKIVTGLRVVG